MADPTVRELFRDAVSELEKHGIGSAAAEVRLLLAEACGTAPAELPFSTRPVAAAELAVFRDFLRRRIGREPAQYIIGKAYFYDLELAVDPAVLIPRPETELVVDRALELLPRSGSFLDLGTGSGAIALSVACHRRDVRVTAADVSAAALAVAERNARRVGAENVEFVRSDLFSALTGRRFDVIAANLPYVPEEDRPTLSREVLLHEPSGALFAADGGFALIDRALDALPPHLVPGGHAVFELDPRQAERARAKFASLGFSAAIRRDLTGRERFVEGVAPR